MSRRRAVLLAGSLLFAAACQTVIDPNRVPEGGGQTVTVSSAGVTIIIPGDPPQEIGGPNSCPSGAAVEVFIDDGLVPVGTGTADGSGDFEIEITAPTEPGSYEVYAVCTLEVTDGPPVVDDLSPITLIVEPDLEMSADPTQLGPGEEFDVTGTWCVSQDDDADPPTASVTFEGETQDFTAPSSQPFGESWTATFDAPDAAGPYVVTATCTYDEVDPDSVDFEIPDLPDGAAVAGAGVSPAAVDAAYAPVTVVVVVPEVPEEPETPRAPEAEAEEGVQPSFVG